MKHPADTKTLELPDVSYPPKPRRGRPPTGTAQTNAERQKARRDRLKAAGVDSVTLTLPIDVIEALRKFVEFKDLTQGEAVEKILRDRLLRKR